MEKFLDYIFGLIIKIIKKLFGFKENSINIEKKKYKYKINDIMTRRELGFFKWLKENLKDNQEINIFTKIRLADLLKIEDFESYGEKMSLFRKISQKHIDFILSDINGKIICLIEVDDNTHNYQKKTIENDKFKNELFEELEVPLIRFKIGETWDFEKIKEIIYGNGLTEMEILKLKYGPKN